MKINITNEDKIQAAIDKAEGRATARTMTHEVLSELVKDFEEQFPTSKKAMEGIIIEVAIGFGGTIPASYRYAPESTEVQLKRFSSGWFLINAYRMHSKPGDDRVSIIGGVDDKMKTAILNAVINKAY